MTLEPGDVAEGVRLYHLEFDEVADLSADALPDRLLDALEGWRSVLRRLDLIGRDPLRYGGEAFGNLSCRVNRKEAAAPGHRAFVISASRTGERPRLGRGGWSSVTRWDVEAHRLTARGAAPPSSEAMSHAAIYDGLPTAGAVLHVHAPEIWEARAALGLPTTAGGAAAGTAAIVSSMRRLLADRRVVEGGVVAMAGHPDGVLAFGASLEEAAHRLLSALARALGAAG
ncbi:MAG: class II aldolase/adducin family protein [Acidobacteriota bacterium]